MNTYYAKKTMPELNRLTPEELKNKERSPITLILDNVRSRNNVGAIFRTADAFRVNKIYLCGFTPTPPHRDINKTALGATETVPWEHHDRIQDLLTELKKDALVDLWAIEQTHHSLSLSKAHQFLGHKRKPVLIFGNEVSGVGDEALALCQGAIEIPQWGCKHSFNISVSVGITLWEVFQQINGSEGWQD